MTKAEMQERIEDLEAEILFLQAEIAIMAQRVPKKRKIKLNK